MGHALVLQTDFGVSDGAVSAMYGVAVSVEKSLKIFDLTHDIPPYNIWEASYRLLQTVSYWPAGTVFVSVVDPGVGSNRRSVAVQTSGGQVILTPDNGSLTHIKRKYGIIRARTIDEQINRLPHSGESYTFHGRDIYAYTGARLAAGVIDFEGIGPEMDVESIVELPLVEAFFQNKSITGIIEILDIRFGNLWTNIHRSFLKELQVKYGETIEITIENDRRKVYRNKMIFGRSFADRSVGEPIIYVNSLDYLGVAINQGSFANAYGIETGSNWKITIRR